MNPNIKIRQYAVNDTSARLEAIIESQDHLLPWIPWAKDYDLKTCEEWIKTAIFKWGRSKDYCFAVLDEDDHYLGEVKLLNVTKDYYESSCNLSYWIRKSYVRRGAAVAAAKLAAEFAFKNLGLYRIDIMIMPDNLRSHSVAKKLGAKEEGYLRNKWVMDDQPRDVILYSLIPADFGL